jgi:hypothetical protein
MHEVSLVLDHSTCRGYVKDVSNRKDNIHKYLSGHEGSECKLFYVACLRLSQSYVGQEKVYFEADLHSYQNAPK